ncbi:formin y 2 domain containing [Cichlidogyrus casuarinus]|uniref:Formin y 2 domain containing n=1 Tax=Cichlidogyrus casuarinus TaxID=1844966 RepID=A0ABD2Q3F7_9PLAT
MKRNPLPRDAFSNFSQTESTDADKRNLNLGGRYLRQSTSSSASNIAAADNTQKSSWRQSVYGVDYSSKRQDSVEEPTTPRTLTDVEKKRLEREKQLQDDRRQQIQLEIERENRRLRQLERKARWEKDETKIKEIEEEISKRSELNKKLLEELENKPFASTTPLKKTETTRQSSFRNMQSSSRSSQEEEYVSDSLNTKPQSHISTGSVILKNRETNNNGHQEAYSVCNRNLRAQSELPSEIMTKSVPQAKMTAIKEVASPPSHDGNGSGDIKSHAQFRQNQLMTPDTPVLRRRAERARSVGLMRPEDAKRRESYVSDHTDIDAFLKMSKFPKRHTQIQQNEGKLSPKSAIKMLQRDGSFMCDEYYTDSDEMSEEEEDEPGDQSMVFKSKNAKDEFNKLPIEIQTMILKRKGKPIKFHEIVYVCRNSNYGRQITDEDEKMFKGYATTDEMLESLGVNVERLEDCALQLYKFAGAQTEWGLYLDVDSSIQDQMDDLDGINLNENNTIVLRTKLLVRVNAIIDKLQTSSGREHRRALFSLKQIFQEDKDLVHEFVMHAGLECLVRVGSQADQNNQNYILRALGQIMLYVDGMQGVISHQGTVEWLYSLLSSKYRLVMKTALKLLLVFVEYIDTNAFILISAIENFHGRTAFTGQPWAYIIQLLQSETSDTQLLMYTMTLINKLLFALPDQDTFYDVTDRLEELGMQQIITTHLSKSDLDQDLAEQFHLYEANLKFEDGESLNGVDSDTLRDSLRQKPRPRLATFLETAEGQALRASMGNIPSLLKAEQPDLMSSSVYSSDTLQRKSKRALKQLVSSENIPSLLNNEAANEKPQVNGTASVAKGESSHYSLSKRFPLCLVV